VATPFATLGLLLASPTPRMLTEISPPELAIEREGEAYCRSVICLTALPSRSSPWSAVIAIGTSCAFSLRRCAVIVISSSVSEAAPGAVSAGAALPPAKIRVLLSGEGLHYLAKGRSRSVRRLAGNVAARLPQDGHHLAGKRRLRDG
jgi:hypothetical protein